ncbi:hypothetical protein MCOL2_20608 [Listeria fleischmannii FSL S10-1203]|uniref:Uncharacterized protein n=2 Tax=Listeria fleischmannii TaxID=1069827 RepID=W7DD42_9LIST|nr:hypothetical protein MCOL2_20608 [Listeria fleischmannii FSL S10-1203]
MCKKNQMKAAALEKIENDTQKTRQKLWEEHQRKWADIQQATEELERHLGCPGYFREEIALLEIPFHELMQDMERKIADYQDQKVEVEAEMDDLIEIGRQLEQGNKL